MAKFCLKKQSKRIPARRRYKIEKKVRDHNKKVRREARKNPKQKKRKLVEVPNQCPFKEDILKEVEEMRKQNEEEKRKLKEAARERKKQELAKNGLEGLVSTAEGKLAEHQAMETDTVHAKIKEALIKEENSLKAYYKEFKKVLDASDVVLEVVDARDPLGTRCKQVEEAVRAAPGNKRLVIVLNKADLVPRENLDQWLKYLRGSLPAVAFKSSTQSQANRLGRRRLGRKTEKMIQGGTCFGAELLLSLLGNYCRSKSDVKTSIRVGVVGLPNVGKSSVINSLKRSRACSVGNTPGVTKAAQVVQLDSKIRLLDSPGIVFAEPSEGTDGSSVALKNAVKIQSLKDPYTPACSILKRVPKEQLVQMYSLSEFETPEEFFALKAARMGKFRKGGIPDTVAAARSILEDWNSGKIRYYTVPPEVSDCQVSAELVSEVAKEFDLERFVAEEKMVLDSLEREEEKTAVVIDSTGPVQARMEIELQKDAEIKIQERNARKVEAKRSAAESKMKKKKKLSDPLSEIEGNQKLNKLAKLQFKKEKKERARKEKAAMKLGEDLSQANPKSTDDYDFNTDFTTT